MDIRASLSEDRLVPAESWDAEPRGVPGSHPGPLDLSGSPAGATAVSRWPGRAAGCQAARAMVYSSGGFKDAGSFVFYVFVQRVAPSTRRGCMLHWFGSQISRAWVWGSRAQPANLADRRQPVAPATTGVSTHLAAFPGGRERAEEAQDPTYRWVLPELSAGLGAPGPC
mgnify:FL=1